MSDGFWIGLFAGLPAIISAAASAYVLVRQNRIEKQVDLIHTATNSMKDALIAGAAREGFTAGVKSEKDAARGT